MPLAPSTRARLQATLACIVTLALWIWRGGVLAAAIAGVAAALALVAWTSPARYAPIQRALDRGIHLLLAGLTWLLLGLFYFLVITPLRAVLALIGNDPLRRSFNRAADTYLQPPAPGSTGRFDRQF